MIRTRIFASALEVTVLMATGLGVFLSNGSLCQAALSDCIDATCRITTAEGSCGSGCVFEIGNGSVYVLTAGHVAGNAAAVQCEFWRHGHQSSPLAGQVIGRSAAADAAVVAVPAAALGGLLPAAIPLAPRGEAVRAGDTLASVGCAGGSWSTGWKGHALGYEAEELRFVPAPANGRSGSALFDGEGKRIVGIITARTGDGAQGIATPIAAVYRAFDFDGRLESRLRRENTAECPNCPNGQCPLQDGRGYLLPYRQKQAQPQNPWPSLGGAAAPVPDYSAKLDKLIELQEKAIAASSQPPVAGPQSPDYGPQVREATERAIDAGKKADEAKAAIKPAIDEALKPVHEDLTKLKPAIELADKVNARLEKLAELPGPLGKPAQKIEADLAAGNVDQAFRDAAKTAGAVLLVLGVIAAVTLHLIGQHKGALRVLADQLAAQNPSNTTLQTIAQKIDSVEDQIASKLPAMPTIALPAAAIPAAALPAAVQPVVAAATTAAAAAK
jgi:hypothetical protein